MIVKPNALVYCRRNDLFIGGKRISPVKMKFTPNLTSNLEVLDPDLFITTCQEFFSAHGLKGRRVLLVLDQSIVFTKRLELNDTSKEQVHSEVERYTLQMPFSNGQRSAIYLQNDTLLQIFATNAVLYQVIQEALRNCGIRKLVAITPAAAYKIDYTAKPTAVIDQFLEDKEVLRVLDFSTTSPN